jgi:hypothetical protein
MTCCLIAKRTKSGLALQTVLLRWRQHHMRIMPLALRRARVTGSISLAWRRLLQFGVLRLGLLQDRDVGGSVCPERLAEHFRHTRRAAEGDNLVHNCQRLPGKHTSSGVVGLTQPRLTRRHRRALVSLRVDTKVGTVGWGTSARCNPKKTLLDYYAE